MNCPNCLSIMSCRSEINYVDDRTSRMDLHCFNSKCPNRSVHMGVLVRLNETWECLTYTFEVTRNNIKYQLKGATKGSYRNYNVNYSRTTLAEIKEMPMTWASKSKNLIETDFIPISTGNDMHLDVNNVVDRLIRYCTDYEFLR